MPGVWLRSSVPAGNIIGILMGGGRLGSVSEAVLCGGCGEGVGEG